MLNKILLLVFLFPAMGKSQEKILPTKIFAGINSVILTDTSMLQQGWRITTTKGKLKISNERTLVLQICPGEDSIVTLKAYNKKKLMDSVTYKVTPAPEPMINVSWYDDEINFTFSGISAEYAEYTPCPILQFTIMITRPSGDKTIIENKGGGYCEAARVAFRSMKKGDRLTYFNFIIPDYCNNTTRILKNVISSVYSGRKFEFRM